MSAINYNILVIIGNERWKVKILMYLMYIGFQIVQMYRRYLYKNWYIIIKITYILSQGPSTLSDVKVDLIKEPVEIMELPQVPQPVRPDSISAEVSSTGGVNPLDLSTEWVVHRNVHFLVLSLIYQFNL